MSRFPSQARTKGDLPKLPNKSDPFFRMATGVWRIGSLSTSPQNWSGSLWCRTPFLKDSYRPFQCSPCLIFGEADRKPLRHIFLCVAGCPIFEDAPSWQLSSVPLTLRCLHAKQHASTPVSSNERYFLLKLLFDTLFVLASVFLANERYLVFER